MPRHARQKSESGIYHIIMRGNNRQTVFLDEEDYNRFLSTLSKFKRICSFKLYAYCLMDNHIHLLLKLGVEPLEKIMRRVCGSYVHWYNQKYERIGNLFQDRFKSEPIDSDEYYLTVLRYIHQNPVKAGLVKNPEQYHWSSYNTYIQTQPDVFGLMDTDDVMGMFSSNQGKALDSFKKYHQSIAENANLNLESIEKVSDSKAIEILMTVFPIKNINDLYKLNNKKRDEGLKKLKWEFHLTIRQIERLTGINRGIVERA